MLIVLDGPEKAGKSTLARRLREDHGAVLRHWHAERLAGGDAVYVSALRDYIAALREAGGRYLEVWDRSWASEFVYDWFYTRTHRRLVNDPWLGEWLYGRAAQALGERVILLGPDDETLRAKRDASDADIPVAEERQRYREYGERFGWQVLTNGHSDRDALMLSNRLVKQAKEVELNAPGSVPFYAGPPRPKAVFITGLRTARQRDRLSGAWLPFSSPPEWRYGRALGDQAFSVGWAYAEQMTLEQLGTAEVLFPVGLAAAKAVADWVGWRAGNVVALPDARWLFETQGAETLRPVIELVVRKELQRVQPTF